MPQSEPPKPPVVREFVVTLSAESHTVFDMPKTYGASNCSGRAWRMAHEEEDRSFESRKPPAHLKAVNLGNGNVGFLDTDVADLAGGVPAGGSITRDARITTGKDGGTCGGGSPASVDVGDDCGTKMVSYRVVLQVAAGKLSINPHKDTNAPDDQGRFVDCGLMYPEEAEDGGWPHVTAPIDPKAFWHGSAAIRLKASKTFTERPFEGANALSTAKSSWTVTLQPVVHRKPVVHHRIKKKRKRRRG